MPWLLRGVYVVASGGGWGEGGVHVVAWGGAGGHVWLLGGRGACMVAWGACVVAPPGGVHVWFLPGGHAWFFAGGVRGFFWGVCMVFSGERA